MNLTWFGYTVLVCASLMLASSVQWTWHTSPSDPPTTRRRVEVSFWRFAVSVGVIAYLVTP